jgi:hypothetical protein
MTWPALPVVGWIVLVVLAVYAGAVVALAISITRGVYGFMRRR